MAAIFIVRPISSCFLPKYNQIENGGPSKVLKSFSGTLEGR